MHPGWSYTVPCKDCTLLLHRAALKMGGRRATWQLPPFHPRMKRRMQPTQQPSLSTLCTGTLPPPKVGSQGMPASKCIARAAELLACPCTAFPLSCLSPSLGVEEIEKGFFHTAQLQTQPE